MTSVAISMPMPSTSSIRRKPMITYRSPTASSQMDGLTFISRATSVSHTKLVINQPHLRSLSTSSTSGSSLKAPASRTLSSSPSPASPGSSQAGSAVPPKRKRYPMGPPLPLYHPLGPLAQSLPLLDPTEFGLPTAPIRIDEDARRSSARARRPAAKLRDAEEEPPSPAASVGTGNGPAARDAKETPKTPRKRRAAAGGAVGGAKRRRREPEDTDTTYATKRTRLPRGQGNIAAAAAAAEAGSPTESQSGETPSTPKMDTGVDLPTEGPQLGRRTTRSRNGRKRRGSSASEATSVSVTGANVKASGTASQVTEDAYVPMVVEGDSAVVEETVAETGKAEVELEEGEVAEDA